MQLHTSHCNAVANAFIGNTLSVLAKSFDNSINAQGTELYLVQAIMLPPEYTHLSFLFLQQSYTTRPLFPTPLRLLRLTVSSVVELRKGLSLCCSLH